MYTKKIGVLKVISVDGCTKKIVLIETNVKIHRC
jgi:hypothetical protein